MIIESEPSGAEIEINDEFIGNTPSIVSAKEGKATVRIIKAGFQTWQRSLKLNAGDKRTIRIEMQKAQN